MRPRRNSAKHCRLIFAGMLALPACLLLLSLPNLTRAASSPSPLGVLVLYYGGKDYPANIEFEQSFLAALRPYPAGAVEYYAEYLEPNRFPGENQSLLQRDYLRGKYADCRIDVVVAETDIALNFLLKYRDELFPDYPIVFFARKRPELINQEVRPGLTGIVAANSYRNTVNLALSLHPSTEQAFIITGYENSDKTLESIVQDELKEFESRISLNYLTNLPLDDLIARVKSLPERSIILYVRYSYDEPGKSLGPRNILDLISRSAKVPVYGIAEGYLGHGIVGGYVFSHGALGTQMAEIALRIAKGTRIQDIPVEKAVVVPMFDWRQLRRWGISEDRLPSKFVVRFKEPGLWEHYKYLILGAIGLFSLCVVEALLIGGLLLQRIRRRRIEDMLSANQERLTLAQEAGQVGTFDWDIQNDVILWSEKMKPLYGLRHNGSNGATESPLEHIHPEDYEAAKAAIERAKTTGEVDAEWRVIWPDKSVHWLHVRGKIISDHDGEPLRIVGVNVDITERKQAEVALQESEDALRESYQRIEYLAGRLIVTQEDERKHIARELHDDLNQQVASIAIGLSKLNQQLATADKPIRNQITKLEDRTAQLSERVRRMSHELHSSKLEHTGLPEALKYYCSEFSEQEGITIDLDIQDGCEAVPVEVALCLYRVAQESLRNIAKHSGAKSAEVTLSCNGAYIKLRIADQGIGFDPEQLSSRRGLGLVSLEERVKLLHGSFELKSQPGSGTELIVQIPLMTE